MILLLVGYFGAVLAFLSLTLAIASGLYYLSEQVEEHTVFTKKLLGRVIFGIIGLHVLLLIVDRFPFWLTLFSIAAHVVYLQNLKRFPYINLSSGVFIASGVMVCLNHWFWFRHFSDPEIPPYSIYYERPSYQGATHPPFVQVASFFGLCVWLVPFALFISLSASDNVLPFANDALQREDDGGDESGAAKAKRRSASVAKVLIEKLWTLVAQVGQRFGFEWAEPNHGRIV